MNSALVSYGDESFETVGFFSAFPCHRGESFVMTSRRHWLYTAERVDEALGIYESPPTRNRIWEPDEHIVFVSRSADTLLELPAAEKLVEETHVEPLDDWQTVTFGYYSVVLGFDASDNKDVAESWKLMPHGWQQAPMHVTLTLVLSHLARTGKDLMRGKMCRVEGQLKESLTQACLTVRDGRLHIGVAHNSDARSDLRMAICRKLI
jgi:hypothetical protein